MNAASPASFCSRRTGGLLSAGTAPASRTIRR